MPNSHKPVRRQQRTRRVAIIVIVAMVGTTAIATIGALIASF